MSLESTAAATNAPDLQSIAAKLDALDASVASVVRGARVRNFFLVVIAVVSVMLIGFWLAYAHTRFSSEVNPDLVADLGQKYLEDYIPSAAAQLEMSLKENAPSVVAEGEKRLRALPVRLDDQFRADARREIEARMPEVQDRLYVTLKAGIADAQSQVRKSPGEDDAARFRNLAESLATLYRSETRNFADDTYARYTKSSGDILNGLNMLAEARNLTPQQKTQRNLIRDFLILAREAAGPQPRTLPDAT